MITKQSIIDTLQKVFDSGEDHYTFALPENPEDIPKMIDIFNSLEREGFLLFLSSPEDGDDCFFVEKFPPCCVPYKGDY